MKKMTILAVLCSLAMGAMAQVNEMLGTWTTIDDKTGEPKSQVEIYKANDGLYYGRIVHLYLKPADAICEACEGKDAGANLVGLNIIRGMKADGNALIGGRILDPENGKLYYVKITLKDGKLNLRGSLDKMGMLGRSQTWERR